MIKHLLNDSMLGFQQTPHLCWHRQQVPGLLYQVPGTRSTSTGTCTSYVATCWGFNEPHHSPAAEWFTYDGYGYLVAMLGFQRTLHLCWHRQIAVEETIFSITNENGSEQKDQSKSLHQEKRVPKPFLSRKAASFCFQNKNVEQESTLVTTRGGDKMEI